MLNINEFEKKQIIFVFLSSGEKVSFSNDNIVVKDADGKIKHQSTCYRLFAVFVVGHITVTSGLIQRAHKFGFSIIFMTHGMKVYDFIGGKMEGNVLLRKHQYGFDDPELGLAKHILENKIRNQRINISLQRSKDEEQQMAINQIKHCEEMVSLYKGDLSGLLGIEGAAARIYFKNYFNNIEWLGRKPRIKNDYVNSTLDIGYTILFNILDALLNVYGFDTYCGILHRQFYMRKSLVCDFIEPFRILVDRQVRKSINLGQCSIDDFDLVNHRYLLKWKKNNDYVKFLLEPILNNRRALFLYIQTYYRCFMKQKDIKDYPVFKLEENI